MKINNLIDKLKEIPQLKDFVWKDLEDDATSAYATMSVTPKHFRDKDKNELKLGDNYSIFVAHMYKDKPEHEFFYIIICRRSEQRYFRKWYFNPIEYNKRFISGKSIQEVMKNVKGLFDEGYSFI